MSHHSASNHTGSQHGPHGAHDTLHEAVRGGALGAMVGSMISLPAAYAGARNGTCTTEQAIGRVLRDGGKTAVAAAIGTAAASFAGSNTLLRTTVMLIAGATALHMLSQTSGPPSVPAPSREV